MLSRAEVEPEKAVFWSVLGNRGLEIWEMAVPFCRWAAWAKGRGMWEEGHIWNRASGQCPQHSCTGVSPRLLANTVPCPGSAAWVLENPKD